MSIQSSRTDVAKLLIERGVHTTLTDDVHHNIITPSESISGDIWEISYNKQEPIEVAIVCDNSEIAKLLLDSGVPIIQGLLISAAKKHNLQTIGLLISAGADVNERDEHDNTPLFFINDIDILPKYKQP